MSEPGIGLRGIGLRPLIAVAVSAAAFVLAFPPFDLGPLAWVALIPLIAAVWRRAPRDAFWLGYIWGALALGGVFWWLTWFGAAVWILAAALLALAPAVALGAAAVAGAGDPRRTALWVPVTWTAVEFLRAQGPLGAPWALLGETQHAALAVSQIASLTGVSGVTFLLALANAVGALVLVRAAGAIPIAVTLAAVAATVAYGTAALAVPLRADTTAAILQPGYPVRLRWNPDQAARGIATLNGMTHAAAAESPSLVVWPETASPVDVADDPAMRARIGDWARRDRATLIATSLEGGATNSAFAFAPDGAMVGRYDKHRLVPFAESGERPGRGTAVLPTPAGGLGVAICFESTFAGHARRAVLDGAALLAVLTNDAWFGGRAAPLQHAAIAPFRAIEEGRFLLRAANAGPSEIIDPRGRVVDRLPLGARGILTGRIAPRTGLTWYARSGDVLAWAAVIASAIATAPFAIALGVGEGRGAAFARLAMATGLPLAALAAAAAGLGPAGQRSWPALVPALAALAVTALLSRGRSAREVGFGRGFVPALGAALAGVACLVAITVRAFTAHGAPIPLMPPPGGWVLGTASRVVIGFALEWWLRGIVFAAAEAWRGRVWAVGWSAALGALAAAPRGPEAMVWGLTAGVVFGLIRVRWAQVPALALAHGIGSALLAFLMSPV